MSNGFVMSHMVIQLFMTEMRLKCIGARKDGDKVNKWLIGYTDGQSEQCIIADDVKWTDDTMELKGARWAHAVEEVDKDYKRTGEWHWEVGELIVPADAQYPLMYMPLNRLIRWHMVSTEKIKESVKK